MRLGSRKVQEKIKKENEIKPVTKEEKNEKS